MSKYTKAAAAEVNGSPVISDRTKLKTGDILGMTLSIDEVDLITINEQPVGVFHFLEFPDKYYFGGQQLTEILTTTMLPMEDGILDEVNKNLKAEPLLVKLRETKTRSGKSFTQVEIIE